MFHLKVHNRVQIAVVEINALIYGHPVEDTEKVGGSGGGGGDDVRILRFIQNQSGRI